MKSGENYLLRRPLRREDLLWEQDADGLVTLQVFHRGLWDRLFQRLLHKPKTTLVRLDALGSFLWPRLDGKRDLLTLGRELEAQFGREVQPLYRRLCLWMASLEQCRFIRWAK